jgi:hypothetical protein
MAKRQNFLSTADLEHATKITTKAARLFHCYELLACRLCCDGQTLPF